MRRFVRRGGLLHFVALAFKSGSFFLCMQRESAKESKVYVLFSHLIIVYGHRFFKYQVNRSICVLIICQWKEEEEKMRFF